MQTIIEWLGTSINSEYGLALRLDLLVRLVLAVVLGGAISWERESSSKPAGLLTNILIVWARLCSPICPSASADSP